MKYYWSCWCKKDELKDMGAVGIIRAQFGWNSLSPIVDNDRTTQELPRDPHYAFQADDSFPIFLKLKSDKSVTEISKRYYLTLQRGDLVKIGDESKPGKALRSVLLDF